ncbi:MAG: hypothetical protein WD294_00660 [Phycisphaeraceae bacterium]
MVYQHPEHEHRHGPACGHTAIRHANHVDYVHDGHLHHPVTGDNVEEHKLDVSDRNPDRCEPTSHGHPDDHVHGPGCGHEAVPHGEHVCYLVDGRLHHPHGDHCDDHGEVEVVQKAAQL